MLSRCPIDPSKLGLYQKLRTIVAVTTIKNKRGKNFRSEFYSIIFPLPKRLILQVEFEARSPEEEDYHGIKRLLQQLFLRSAAVNVGKVTETILNQKFIGSVIKQSVLDNEEEEEGGEDLNEVYAISTVINLAEKNK